MRYLIGLALGCALGLGALALPAQAGLDDDCRSGTNDIDLKIRACSELIRRNPRDGWAYGTRGDGYLAKGDNNRAIADFSKALQLSPGDDFALAGRGAAYYHRKDDDRALADLNEAIRRKARNAYALSYRGAVYLQKGKYDRALADLNEAITIDPRDSASYWRRGETYRMKHDYARAVADFNKALQLNPSDKYTHASRGEVFRLKGEFARAIADLDEALSRRPHDAFAYGSRGAAYRLKGDYGRAVADLNKALEIDPFNSFASAELSLAKSPLLSLAPTQEKKPAPVPTLPSKEPNTAPTQPHKEPAPPKANPRPPVVALGRRVALVIGNAAYKVGPLQNPGNDATAIAEALEKQLRFEKVTLRLDLKFDEFRSALRDFQREASRAGLALVYYAGHATERAGKNYLIPIDAKLDNASDLALETIPLTTVLEQIDGANRLKLVILDSCRNNVFPLGGENRGETRGLTRVEPGRNTLVVYAAKEGTVAADGIGHRHSPFTAALLKRIATPDLEVRFLFGEVRDDVLAATAHQKEPQEPFVYGSLGGERIFLRTTP
jgi:tetratricopeptide (TPR) repeat protein